MSTTRKTVVAGDEIQGVSFKLVNQYAMCCIEDFSDDLKEILKENLSRICHGADQASRDRAMFKYPATLKVFWERYHSKSWETRVGMLGELLSHVIVLRLFPRFDVVSPFFNLEEKSIKKGFDLLLYEVSENSVWITEVKSGEKSEGKTPCDVTKSLLRKAHNDLKLRLAEQEFNHWQNAINAARNSIHAKKDYRDSVLEILELEGDLVAENSATASDNNVFLISVLFDDVSERVIEENIKDLVSKLVNYNVFNAMFALSLQKGTLQKIEQFLQEEAGLLVCEN